MAEEWTSDTRKILDETMGYLRKVPVRAIEENTYGPELIVDIPNISRPLVYDWLKRYRESGWAALESRPAPGPPPLITPAIEEGLRQTVLEKTPGDFGHATALWTRDILAELLHKHFGLAAGGSMVGLRLRRLRLRYRQPRWPAGAIA